MATAKCTITRDDEYHATLYLSDRIRNHDIKFFNSVRHTVAETDCRVAIDEKSEEKFAAAINACARSTCQEATGEDSSRQFARGGNTGDAAIRSRLLRSHSRPINCSFRFLSVTTSRFQNSWNAISEKLWIPIAQKLVAEIKDIFAESSW